MKTADYIDRKRAANFLCKIICGSDRELCVSTPENCQQKRMMEFFELPAADVVPVVRGEWIINAVNGNGVVGNWKCSVCKGVSLKNTPFCPNCGADMSSE